MLHSKPSSKLFVFGMVSVLPFLVFEVLEGQVYNFLDESIQKRMEGDLESEKTLSFYSEIITSTFAISSYCFLCMFKLLHSIK